MAGAGVRRRYAPQVEVMAARFSGRRYGGPPGEVVAHQLPAGDAASGEEACSANRAARTKPLSVITSLNSSGASGSTTIRAILELRAHAMSQSIDSELASTGPRGTYASRAGPTLRSWTLTIAPRVRRTRSTFQPDLDWTSPQAHDASSGAGDAAWASSASHRWASSLTTGQVPSRAFLRGGRCRSRLRSPFGRCVFRSERSTHSES